MTDLITSCAVKKVYRKATLCIHPDKVQQKGASVQQKYIAEKVFDILKVLSKFSSYDMMMGSTVITSHGCYGSHRGLMLFIIISKADSCEDLYLMLHLRPLRVSGCVNYLMGR